MNRVWMLHLAVLVLLLAAHFLLPSYHHGQVARIMVLAIYAMGYNILFGYTGLLSLGHAMLFAAGMYGMGLSVQHLGLGALSGFTLGVICALCTALIVGLLALRTIGVAFMIVTLMFSQAGYLAILYFGTWTRGDEGFVVNPDTRQILGHNLADADNRYMIALILFAVTMLIKLWLVRAPEGRVMIAIRENEERATMLGFNTWAHKLLAVVISGGFAGIAGAAYGLLFGYVGASFAHVPYSIFPLLWVLLGGAGTVLGPLIGTGFMVYLIDYASGLTDAYMLIVGLALVALVLFARRGIMGLVRDRMMPWLP